MRFYFDGCSHTWGAELAEPEVSRYSKLVSDHFGAEEYNISRRGGSDKRVFRNLIETDLSKYDYVIVQLTCKTRTEFWSESLRRWISVKSPRRVFRKGGLALSSDFNTLLDHDTKYFLKNYWKCIYTEKLGHINQLTYYHAMRNVLKDKKHLIIGINGWGHVTQVPVDLKFTNFKCIDSIEYKTAPLGHVNEEGHKIIAEEIIKHIEKHK